MKIQQKYLIQCHGSSSNYWNYNYNTSVSYALLHYLTSVATVAAEIKKKQEPTEAPQPDYYTSTKQPLLQSKLLLHNNIN